MGWIANIIAKYLNVEELEKAMRTNRIRKQLKHVTIGARSALYEQTVVFNFQNDDSKIIIGSGTHIRAELLIFANGGKISIGDNCYVGEGSRIWSANEVRIGNNVLVSHNVNIIDSDSHEINHLERAASYKALLSKGHPKEKINVNTAPIIIEDYVWISYNVCILKGIKIGKGAIVAAGSVVTKDVSDFSVVAGNPAKEIKRIENV